MKNIVKYALFVFILISFNNCQQNKLSVIKLKKEKSIDILSDSTLFSNVECLSVNKGAVFFTNTFYDQLVNLDETLSLIKTIGTRGQGPNELLDINQFAIQDSLIVVLNGNNRINIFNINGELLEEHSLTGIPIRFDTGHRFHFNGEEIIGSSAFSENPLTVYNIYTNEQTFFGEKYKFALSNQTAIRNDRFVRVFGDKCVAVSDNMPFIEIYDLKSKENIEKYDYSTIYEIEKSLKAIERKDKNPNSYYTLCRDICLVDDYLYVLFISYAEKFEANKIIKFELVPSVNPVSIIELPGEIYSSFCISDYFVYGYNSRDNTIEQYLWPF